MINIKKTIFLILLCQSLTVYSFSLAEGSKIAPWITLASLCVFLKKTNSLRNTILLHAVEPFFNLNKSFYSKKNNKFFHISKIAAIGVDGAFYYSAKYCAHMFRYWLNNNSTSRMFEKKDIPVLLCSVLLSLGAVRRAALITDIAFHAIRNIKSSYFLMEQKDNEDDYSYYQKKNHRMKEMEMAYQDVKKDMFGGHILGILPLALVHARKNNLPIDMLPAARKHFYAIYDRIINKTNELALMVYHENCIKNQVEDCIKNQVKDKEKHVTGLPDRLKNQVFNFLEKRKD